MLTGTLRPNPKPGDAPTRSGRRCRFLASRAPTAFLPLAALLGCTAANPSATAPGWVPPGEERLAFIGGAKAATQRAVRFDDGDEIEEYGRVASGAWRAEYLYVAADGDDTSLQASFDVERATRMFVHNASSGLTLGPVGRIDRPAGNVLFRPFTRPGEACFGFEGDLARDALDPEGQPSELLLGYACRDGSEPPAPSDVKAFLDGVFPLQATTPDHVVALPPDPDALDFAAGHDRPGTGLFGYPLGLARRYVIGDAELPDLARAMPAARNNPPTAAVLALAATGQRHLWRAS